ncbi:immunity protein Imm33 domain-containing protein [Telluribacter sp.]|jgi:hypothetical protein|uniref:immunity protein Imm33 domain-containing protein n=1 Tax=Telluribacter sp. TaxID=1978767 RepID=UPI002E10B445|nr:DUF2185 domain-containing protein [Telluribacter sp.]
MFFKKKQKNFKEADNTAVFTTKYVIKDKKPITYVTHEEEDGAWQFFSSDEFENFEEVAMIVGLVEIVSIDSSLLELADMPVGHYAIRETANDKWSIRQQVKPPNVG